MNDPMRILKADHREVAQLLARLADTDEGTERENLVSEVETKLGLHMELEESLVYDLVEEHVGAEDKEEAEIEHGLVRETLTKLREMIEQPGFGAVVEMLRGGISHHVEEEEREILPELKDAMGNAEWRDLGDRIAEAKQAAGMPVAQPQTAKRRSAKRKPRSSAAASNKSRAASKR